MRNGRCTSRIWISSTSIAVDLHEPGRPEPVQRRGQSLAVGEARGVTELPARLTDRVMLIVIQELQARAVQPRGFSGTDEAGQRLAHVTGGPRKGDRDMPF